MSRIQTAEWWIEEPRQLPEEGIKFVYRFRQLLVLIEDRRYRARAGAMVDQQHLQVVLWLWKHETAWHVESLDLCSEAERHCFAAEATQACGFEVALISKDLEVIAQTMMQDRDRFLQGQLAERDDEVMLH